MKIRLPVQTIARAARLLLVTCALLVLGGFNAAPVGADNDGHHKRGRGHGDGHGHEQRDNRFSDSYRHREWRGQDRNYSYRPAYPQPYLYSQPVYVPPPVYYAPRQSPGISLFFPLDLR